MANSKKTSKASPKPHSSRRRTTTPVKSGQRKPVAGPDHVPPTDARRVIRLLRKVINGIPNDPIDFSASQNDVRDRNRRLGQRHDHLIEFARSNSRDLDMLDLLLRRYVPDAFLPPACGTSMDGPAVAGNPFSNFSRCFDLCSSCRFDLMRALDLVDAGLKTGKATEPFVPAAVASARIAAGVASASQFKSSVTSSMSTGKSMTPHELVIDVRHRTATLQGVTYPLTEAATRILEKLAAGNGGWQSGTTLKEFENSGERPDRVISAMPPQVKKCIETKPSAGTRLTIKSRVVLGPPFQDP